MHNRPAPPRRLHLGGGGAAGLGGEVDLRLPGGGQRVLAGVHGGGVHHLPALQRLRLRPALADGQQAVRRILSDPEMSYSKVRNVLIKMSTFVTH